MIGDMGQDDQRDLPERAWPGMAGGYREHEGGGEIVTRALLPLEERGLVECLIPLEGPEDDPWVQGWHAGLEDGLRDAEHRLAMARLDSARERRALVLELAIVAAIVLVFAAIILSI